MAQLLKSLRERKGLSQRELAARASTTGAYVAMLETGAKEKPSRAVLRRLAQALGVAMDVLESADQEIIAILKWRCEKCEREAALYVFDQRGRRMSADRQREVLRKAQQAHEVDEGCPGHPTSVPHRVTKKRTFK